MGVCILTGARPREAEEYFRAALEIKEMKLGSDDLSVAETLSQLGLCVRECDRAKEAEDFFWRALEVQEEKLGEHEQVWYGSCGANYLPWDGTGWDLGPAPSLLFFFFQDLVTSRPAQCNPIPSYPISFHRNIFSPSLVPWSSDAPW